MKRGEVWWAQLPPPAKRRPVLLLSRNEAYAIRALVTVAPLTTRRRNILAEVLLTAEDGVPKKCVVNLDTIFTIPKHSLIGRVCSLQQERMKEVENAIRFALEM